MKSTINMYGINIELGEVPDKKKRKYKRRGKSKALASPRKDKMVREAPIVK